MMSNKKPPDFTKDQVRLITAALKEQYGHDIEGQQEYEENELKNSDQN